MEHKLVELIVVCPRLQLWFIAEVPSKVTEGSAATTVVDITGVVARRFQTEPRTSFQYVPGTCIALKIDDCPPPSFELHGRARKLVCRSNTHCLTTVGVAAAICLSIV